MNLPAITLKKRHALPAFSRHPWVYATSIASEPKGIEPGTEVLVVSQDGQQIARGLYNPHSLIRVRLYSWDIERPVDDGLFKQRIKAAIAVRQCALGQTNAARLIFSEADGISGLTVDAFDRWLVVQLTSLALQDHFASILDVLREQLDPRGIVLRTERGMLEREGLDIQDAVVWGIEPPRPLLIESNGLSWGVDLTEGQKTGFYFDQRANRDAVAKYCVGRSVFDGHTYAGGFALTAAKAGASSVLGVDSSAAAIELAQANAERNGLSGVAQFEKADVSARLNQAVEQGEKFDVVIIDPPKLARTRGGLRRAMKAYTKLNAVAMQAVQPGGILVTCSCSGLVSAADFDAMLRDASLLAGRSTQILESRHADVDHPTSVFCPDTDYLKCRICSVQ